MILLQNLSSLGRGALTQSLNLLLFALLFEQLCLRIDPWNTPFLTGLSDHRYQPPTSSLVFDSIILVHNPFHLG